jgi:flagellar biosynthesis protein FlhG
MRDQAAALRRRMGSAAPELTEPVLGREPGSRAPAVFAVGSGKGGVGKSVLSTMLAASLARLGKRVLLFDAAHNQGNLHVMLGVRPAARLDALVAGDVEPEALLVPLAERLWLLPGDSGAESLYGMTPMDRARLHRRLSALYDDFDAVIVDGGPGIESVVRATIRASRLAVIAVPEPASLSDAYALIKIVHLQIPTLPVDVVVNRVFGAEEANAAFARLALAAERFLKRELRFVGAVSEDPEITRGVREPGLLLGHQSEDVTDLARRIAAEMPSPAGLTEAEAR